MYKKASKMKLRFATTKGNLIVEDLWQLTLPTLDSIAVALDEELSKSPKKSFISTVSPENEVLQLKLNIVTDIISDKLAEKDASEKAQAKKAEKERLLDLLDRKKSEKLESLSEEELQKKLQELD